MAYFRKRSGAWQVVVKKKGFERISRTFDTKAEAEAWANVTESEMVRGVFVSRIEAENTTLSEALDRYQREISSGKKGERQEIARIRLWKAHPLAKRFLASIQGKDIAAFRDERIQAGYASNTIRLELAIISHLFEIARKEWGMAGIVNPVQEIRLPTKPQGRDRRLLPGELEKIIAASGSPFLPDIVRLALETGMRQAEIAGMTWNMVDMKKRTVTLLITKNGDKRIVPLSSEAIRILSGLVQRIDGKVWGITSHAVAVAYRRAVSRARNVYEKECEKRYEKPDPAFLLELTFHDLRHEATSRFFEKGFNVMEVASITGHKTLQMLKRYTHLKAEDLAKRMDG